MNDTPNMQVVPIDLIVIDDEFNCREQISPVSVMGLAEMINRDGLLQPPTVRPLTDPEKEKFPGKLYALVMGFRRTKACKMLDWKEMPVMIKDVDLFQAKILNLVENLGRENITFWEECLALKDMTDAKFSRKDVSEALGQSEGWVQRRQNVWKSPPRVQEMVKAGILGPSHVQALFKYSDAAELDEALDSIMERHKKNATLDPEADGRLKSIYVPKPSATKKNSFTQIKKARGRHEVYNLALFLRQAWNMPDGPWYKILAWAGGEITDEQLLLNLQAFMLEIYTEEVQLPDNGIPEMQE